VSSSNEQQRLADVVENVDAILVYVRGMDFDAFARDRKTVDACERCLERVIEAITKIGSARMSQILASLPVSALRGMGNRLRHEYDLVDLGTIWVTITDDLVPLRDACLAALGDS
jgi:uncharacterized protein with HEPN domain